MGDAIFADHTYQNDVVTLVEQSFGNVVSAWWILIIGTSYLFAVHVGNVSIKECTEQ